MASKRQYLWHKDIKQLVADLDDRWNASALSDDRGTNLTTTIQKSYNAFYGQFWSKVPLGHMGKGGEQGEYTLVGANHLGSLLQAIVNLHTQEKLSFDVQMRTTDNVARNNAKIVSAVIDKYLYEKHLEERLHEMYVLGMITSTSYLHIPWCRSKPYMVDSQEEPVYVWDAHPELLTYRDVLWENPKEHDQSKQNWCVVRCVKNRYNMIAEYPDREEELLEVAPIGDDISNFIDYTWATPQDPEDLIYVYYAYHAESMTLPQGRYTVYCNKEVILDDLDYNPYVDDADPTPNRGIPIITFRPKKRFGAMMGHTPAFDLLPLQDNLNILDSTIATNQLNFGVQNVVADKSAGISVSDVSGGLRLLLVDTDNMGEKAYPKALQLCQTPSEIFAQRDRIAKDMETISGYNAIMRGRIETSTPPTGVAMALATSNGQIMNSDIEHAYLEAVKRAVIWVVYLVAKNQTVDDLVEVVGNNGKRQVESFSGSSVRGIYNINVAMGNPMAKTPAGRVAIAEVLAGAGALESPDQFLEVLNTGTYEPLLQGKTAELSYIRWENEQLRQAQVREVADGQGAVKMIATGPGGDVLVGPFDNHPRHLLEHKTVMDDPEVRQDPVALQAVTMHMYEHLSMLETMQRNNPVAYAIATGQPIPPVQPNPDTGVLTPPGSAPGATMDLSENQADVLDKTLSPTNTASSAQEGPEAGAIAANKRAGKMLAQAQGEIS